MTSTEDAALLQELRDMERNWRSVIGNEPTKPSTLAGKAAARIEALSDDVARQRAFYNSAEADLATCAIENKALRAQLDAMGRRAEAAFVAGWNARHRKLPILSTEVEQFRAEALDAFQKDTTHDHG